ncbi:MAG: ketopantoate reductase family protein [Candidatus Thiodiazotropha sp.]|jgi:2-dehydropantoate 2-reductase
MRFLMLGAGGIGAYYGARLVSAGHDVVFVARGEHLTAMHENGLSIRHPDFSFEQRVQVVDQIVLADDYTVEDFDLVVLTMKSGATDEVMASLHNWLDDSSVPVLSLQNGVDNEYLIESRVGRERTVGGLAVRIGGHITEPGVIEATGQAQIVMGAWKNALQNPTLHQRLYPIVKQFCEAEIPTTLSDEIQKELWRKLLINNGVNPLSALTCCDTRALTSDPVLTRTVYQLMQEAAAAAIADGVLLDQSDVEEMYQLICQFDPIKTSMLVDLEKHRPLELDAISGAVILRMRKQDQVAPLTELIQALLSKRIETLAQQ